MKKIFFIFLKTLVGLVSLLIAALAFCIIFGITVDLSFLKPGVEKAAQSALGREVKINGPVVFEFSHWTAIDVRNIQIANIPNATQPDFFKAGIARLEIALLPLLKGNIRIGEVIAEDVILNLESDAKGEPNWEFGDGSSKEEEEDQKDTNTTGLSKLKISFGGLDKLSLKRITLTYHDAGMKKTFKSQLESMVGEMSPGKPILFSVNGHLNKVLYNIKLKGEPFDDLMKKEKLWAFELEGEVAGKKIAAKGDLRHSQQPEINVAFGIKDIDIGLILSTLGLVDGMSASVGDAGFKFSLKGKSLKQILRESSMYFIVQDGQWKVQLPNSKSTFDITRLNGEIKVEKGNNLTMDLRGDLKDEPLKLKITGSPLVKYIETPDEIPLMIEAELAKMKLEFSSTLALPLTSKDLKLALKFSGERLDTINRLFKLDLPPLGPIAFDARMHVTDKGYDLSKLHVKVKNTNLKGKMNLNVSKKIPKLDIELVSDVIQINDFDFKKSKKEKKVTKKETSEKKLTQKEKQKIRELLSAEVLGSINANIKINAKQVLSGKDKLGSASAIIKLQNSRLAVEPLRVNIPGGGMRVDFSFLPKGKNVVIDLKTTIDKFDIAVIARRAKPGTDMGGTLYLDAKLHSVVPSLKELMKNAKGHFDFGIVPKNFSSGIIDLWAVNLLSALMDKETEKDESVVNCFIMRFGMENGLMQDKIIYMDTTQMRVGGEARINFRTETIDMMMAPKAKKPEFFSLATPIKIQGTFEDFGLKIRKRDIFTTAISFITSPLLVPIKRILVEELPSDGNDACLKAWKYTGNPQSVHQSTEAKTGKKFQEVKKETKSKSGSNLDILDTD